MSAGVTKREADTYMDNLLTECGSYERVYMSTMFYFLIKCMEALNAKTQKECIGRCCR